MCAYVCVIPGYQKCSLFAIHVQSRPHTHSHKLYAKELTKQQYDKNTGAIHSFYLTFFSLNNERNFIIRIMSLISGIWIYSMAMDLNENSNGELCMKSMNYNNKSAVCCYNGRECGK